MSLAPQFDVHYRTTLRQRRYSALDTALALLHRLIHWSASRIGGRTELRGRRNILIAFAAFLVGMLGAILYLREPTQPLTLQALDAARKHWRDRGIRAYEAKYRMNAGLYEVRCRDGIVEDLTVDGRIPNTAEPRSYSVDGLFDLLELEIVNLNDTKGPFGPSAPALMARVRFNADFGYPERYIRAGVGMARGASIEMIEFKWLNQVETRNP